MADNTRQVADPGVVAVAAAQNPLPAVAVAPSAVDFAVENARREQTNTATIIETCLQKMILHFIVANLSSSCIGRKKQREGIHRLQLQNNIVILQCDSIPDIDVIPIMCNRVNKIL